MIFNVLRHNDLAWRYRYYAKNNVYGQYDLRTNLTEVWKDQDNPSHTDIPRMRKGKVEAQVIMSNQVLLNGLIFEEKKSLKH